MPKTTGGWMIVAMNVLGTLARVDNGRNRKA